MRETNCSKQTSLKKEEIGKREHELHRIADFPRRKHGGTYQRHAAEPPEEEVGMKKRREEKK